MAVAEGGSDVNGRSWWAADDGLASAVNIAGAVVAGQMLKAVVHGVRGEDVPDAPTLVAVAVGVSLVVASSFLEAVVATLVRYA